MIEAVLRSNNGAVDTTIDQLLAMSADNEPGGGGASPPPTYGGALPSYGEAMKGGPLGACSSLGPDLLASLGASGGPSSGPLHLEKGWKPPMLGRLPPDFLRLGGPRGGHSREQGGQSGLGHAYTHPERQPR